MARKGDISFVITNHFIRFADNSKKNRNISEHVGEVELPLGIVEKGVIKDPEQLIYIISNLAHRFSWEEKQVAFTLPNELAHLFQLFKTTVNDREGLIIVNQWAGEQHNDRHIKVQNEPNLKLFSYYFHYIQDFTSLLKSARLRGVRADVASQAIFRIFQERISYVPNDVLVVHWNSDVLTMTVYHVNRPVYTKYWYVEGKVYYHGWFEKCYDEVILGQDASCFGQIILSGDVEYLSEVYEEMKELVGSPIYVYGNQYLPNRFMDVVGVARG